MSSTSWGALITNGLILTMARFLIKKILYSLISLFVMVSLTFIMMKSLPGDPFSEEKALPPEVIASLKHHYALDTSLTHQYVTYLYSVVTLNFGPSLVHPTMTVGDIIRTSFPVSAVIGIQALFLSLLLGVISGTWSAFLSNRFEQKILMVIGICMISVPSFIVASILQYFFGVYHEYLPIARWGTWEHTILPTIALTTFPLALIARLVRNNMVQILKLDYIRNARAKGLSRWEILWTHALPNAIIPVIGYMGPLFSSILVGSFVIEKIFGIPGLGQWFVASIMNRDYPVIMGTAVFYSTLLTLFVFMADCLYCFVDPRIHLRSHPCNV